MNLSTLGGLAAAAAIGGAMFAQLAQPLRSLTPDTPAALEDRYALAPALSVAETDAEADGKRGLRSRMTPPLFRECFEAGDASGSERLSARRMPWPKPDGSETAIIGGFEHVSSARQAAYLAHEPAGACPGLIP